MRNLAPNVRNVTNNEKFTPNNEKFSPKGEKCSPKNVATSRDLQSIKNSSHKNIMNNINLYSVGSSRHNLILLVSLATTDDSSSSTSHKVHQLADRPRPNLQATERSEVACSVTTLPEQFLHNLRRSIKFLFMHWVIQIWSVV